MPGLLDKLVYWEEGSYFHQGKLDRLRESLVGLDYFSNIDIQAKPENAVDGRVPVDVNLTLAKRSIYTAGLSYGTDSGAGVRLGVERRYLNSRGHKAVRAAGLRAEAQEPRHPVPHPRVRVAGWLVHIAAQADDEQTDYIDTRLVKFVASRSGADQRPPQRGRLDQHRARALGVLRGRRWRRRARADRLPLCDLHLSGAAAPNTSTSTTAASRAAASAVPLSLRGGVEGVGSDANFAQLHAQARWFKGIGGSDRLILRGELGHTFTDALGDMPPSLRYYAGGDRSIRGYQYREVGPQVETDKGKFSVGAKNVVTASAEYEHYFNASWGAAVFVDSGSAFDGTDADWRTGVGVGVRWKSPVGPVRIDIAHGLDDPDSRSPSAWASERNSDGPPAASADRRDDLPPEEREARIAELRTRRRARMRMLAIRSAIGSAALLVVLAIALYWLLQTVAGRDVLLNQIIARLPAGSSFTWQKVEGRWPGR